jgi:hypothetical protein
MEKEVRERFERVDATIDKLMRAHAAAESRMDRNEALFEKRMSGFEKRMKGFEKLALLGMKELAKHRQMHKETSEKINALIAAQMRNEEMAHETKAELKALQATIRSFINSLEKGRNGR